MKRWVVAAIPIVILVLGGLWAYNWWQSPAETTVVNVADQTERGVLGSESKLIPWRTTLFATRYPANLRVITSNEVSQGITDGQYLFASTSLKRDDQLAVTVGKLSASSIEELSAVKFRRSKADIYQQATRTYAPAGAVVFSNSSSYETAIYWAEDGNYAAVVVSGSSANQADLETALQAVVANWQWL